MKKKVSGLIAFLMVMIGGAICNLNLMSRDNLSSLASSNIEALAGESSSGAVLVRYVPVFSTCTVYVEGECDIVIWIPELDFYCEINVNYSYSYQGSQITCLWTGNLRDICYPMSCE
ncbi:MAG: hypothetical protein LBG80_03890 [Bacteroidales bacterium]|jgi:hypothetical protein|nr:hypothetical protein [Bacteroidales bacterium]